MQNRYVTIGGPEPFSWRDAVAAFERAIGRPIPQRGVEPGRPVPGLPDAVQGILAYMGTSDGIVDGRATADELGVRLQTLDAWVTRLVAGAGSR